MTPGEFSALHAQYRAALQAARHSADLRVLIHHCFLEESRKLPFDPWAAYLSHAVWALATDLCGADLLGVDNLDPFVEWLRHGRRRTPSPDATPDEWIGALESAERSLGDIANARGLGRPQRATRLAPEEDGICSINIPVESSMGHSVSEPFRRLRTLEILRVDVSVSLRLGGRNGHQAGVTGKVENVVRERAENALAHVAGTVDWSSRWGLPPMRACVFDCVPVPSDLWITGASSVLGVVLAATLARASLAPGWSIPRLVPGLAATADLAGDAVVGVELVPEKVRAAARGGLAVLVVARQQEHEATQALDELRSREGPYPLRIVSIGTLSDLPGFPHAGRS